MNMRISPTLVFVSLLPFGARAADGSVTVSKGAATEGAKRPACKASDTLCNYIVTTRQLLAGYQEAIRGQIDRLQQGYAAAGQIAEQGRRDEIASTLRTERNRRSEAMTDDFIHGTRPTWHGKEYLLDYATQDFTANRELLELNSLDGSRFVQGLQSLQAEFDKAQALDKLLVALNQKKTLIDSLHDLADTGEQVKAQVDTLVCGGMKTQLAAKQAALAAATAAGKTNEAAVLNAAIGKINQAQAAKSCN